MKNLTSFFICLLLAVPCQARTITVDDDGPADFNNIQAAINDANDGDTIIVAGGTYTGPGNRDIDFLNKVITVRSIDPNDPNTVAAIIIDCNGTEDEPHRGFYFHNGEDANSVLIGLTITNGFASYEGGGLSCKNSSPTISKCIIRDNYAMRRGGGIYSWAGSPTITNCIFTGNKTELGDLWRANGGGLYLERSASEVTNCTFMQNSSYEGGGLSVWRDANEVVVSNCTFIYNSASGKGGGMFIAIDQDITVTNCVFKGNTAGIRGGGVKILYSCPVVTNCIFTDNRANWYGGAILHYGVNRSGRLGSKVSNCTFVGNSADYGGAIGSLYYSSPTITNCILWDNTATKSGDQVYNITESNPILTYSDVQGDWPGGVGNIDADPCFVEPGYWADANDPNIVVEPNDPNAIWVDGDYHLKSQGWRWDSTRQRWDWDDVTSRCIDAGNPGSPLGDELLSIPDDPNNIWGQNLRINVGAFGGTAEASMPPYDWAILGDLTNDGLVNLTDFAFQSADWLNSADQRSGDLNRDSLIYISDLALLVEDWLKQTTWHE